MTTLREVLLATVLVVAVVCAAKAVATPHLWPLVIVGWFGCWIYVTEHHR